MGSGYSELRVKDSQKVAWVCYCRLTDFGVMLGNNWVLWQVGNLPARKGECLSEERNLGKVHGCGMLRIVIQAIREVYPSGFKYPMWF